MTEPLHQSRASKALAYLVREARAPVASASGSGQYLGSGAESREQ